MSGETGDCVALCPACDGEGAVRGPAVCRACKGTRRVLTPLGRALWREVQASAEPRHHVDGGGLESGASATESATPHSSQALARR